MNNRATQSDERDSTRTKTRRRFLCAIGVGMGASIAGCTGSGNDDGTGGTSSTTQSGESGNGATTTATTTQAATKQPMTAPNTATTTAGEPTTTGELTTAGETTMAPETTAAPTATSTATAQPTATATATATPGGDGGSSALLTAGEYYRFESGASFRVVSTGSDTLTLEINWETGETETVQTPRGEFYLFYPDHIFGMMHIAFAFANTVVSLAQTRSLSVGSQWTVTPGEFSKLELQRKGPSYIPPEGETVAFTITGTDTIAGVSCTKIEAKINGRLWKTGCVNEELAFALSYTGYDPKSGQVKATATVVEYQSGGGG